MGVVALATADWFTLKDGGSFVSFTLVGYIPWTHGLYGLNLSGVRKGNQIAIEFGRALRNQRRAGEISQEALALAADVDRTFVSQMERGIRQPSLTTLWKLATALNVKPSILVVKMEQRLR